MSVAFNQILILFSFGTIGCLLAKCKQVKTEHTPILSSLLVNVILPFNVFKTFSSNFTRSYLSENYMLVLLSAVILILLAVIMNILARLFDKRKYERAIYEYSLIIPNCGYMGYPMAEAVLGEVGLLNLMMFCLPLMMYIYTIAYSKLTKREISFKKAFNPTMLAMLLGALAGLFGIKIPDVISSILSNASVCMGPVSMLLAGIVVSEFNFKEILFQKKLYIVTALRLAVIPIIIGFVIQFFNFRTLLECAVLIYAMPCGLNTIVFPRLVGEDCRIGAGLALISNILACVTIPLVLGLFNIGG